MQEVNRSDYVAHCHELAHSIVFKENLPLVTDILDFAVDEKVNPRLGGIFDFFGDEEEVRELTTRDSINFDEEASKTFIDSVIAANVTDISESGAIYKKLMATGDTFRIRGNDCESEGREVKLPLTEEEFVYNVKNCSCTINSGGNDYIIFDDYEQFLDKTQCLESIWVRTPMTCKHHTKRGCCPVCAGEVPEGVQNLGAFATLMITEVATQNALSSMNKGRKANVNKLLAKNSGNIKTIQEYYDWAEEILQELQGESVERRYYEVALLGRLHVDKHKKKIRVSSLINPDTSNYLGEFIYRPKERSFKKMINAGEFYDESLKAQIALNSYKKGLLL